MANRYATKSGNWSDVTVWDGGVSLPGVGDVVRSNNFIVTIDQDVSVEALANNPSSPAVAGGRFYVSDTAGGTRNLLINYFYAGTSYAVLNITATTGVVIITSLTISPSTSAPNCRAIDVTGTCNVVLNGNITTGSNGVGMGCSVYVTADAGVVVNGTITGGGGSQTGIVVTTGIKDITINGNVYGPYNGSGNGIGLPTTRPVLVNGSAIGNVGTGAAISGGSSVVVTGDSVAGAGPGISSSGSSTVIDVRGEVVASNTASGISATGLNNLVRTLVDAPNGRKAIYAPGWRLPQGELCTETITSDLFETPFSPGSQVVLSNYVSDSPPPSDVRAGKTYGPDGTLVGTMAVPASTQVADGVLVDNTSGTAAIRLSDVADVFGSQVTAVSNG